MSISPGDPPRSAVPAGDLFERHLGGITRRTDRLFAAFLACQWAAAVATALLNAPRSWEGESSRFHAHVWAATLLGGAIVGLPIALCLGRAGAASTRLVVAVAQASMGALLIHLGGGRIETHFHIFGSLALLAFYRDWRVLVTASVVVALDHLVRGHYWPESVFGVAAAGPWRWAEHAGWVAVEDVFLIRSCLQNVREMREIAERESELGRANEGLAREVAERRRAERSLARMAAILDATTDFVAIADASGRALYV